MNELRKQAADALQEYLNHPSYELYNNLAFALSKYQCEFEEKTGNLAIGTSHIVPHAGGTRPTVLTLIAEGEE